MPGPFLSVRTFTENASRFMDLNLPITLFTPYVLNKLHVLLFISMGNNYQTAINKLIL